jgi:hypothetical protein
MGTSTHPNEVAGQTAARTQVDTQGATRQPLRPESQKAKFTIAILAPGTIDNQSLMELAS